MKIVSNTPLINDIFEYDVILFAMGINNSMANGFAYEIGLNFPEVLKSEGRYKYGDIRKFGTIHETESNGIKFIACYILKNSLNKKTNVDSLDYEALDCCLKSINERYPKKNIASYILGVDKYEGNGDKEKTLNIFNKYFENNKKYTLYNIEQTNFKKEIYYKIKKTFKSFSNKQITREEYLKIRRVLEWRKTHGIYEEIPDGYVYVPKSNKKRKIRYTKDGIIFLK